MSRGRRRGRRMDNFQGKKEGKEGEDGTRHKHTGTLDKFNTHTLGVINLTLVPAKEFRV